MIRPSMELSCQTCGDRWPRDTKLEAVRLHFNVDHDTDDIELRLSAVCTCGAEMGLTDSRPTGGGVLDYFECPACHLTGRLKRRA